jgi:hypothetical protein
MAKHQALAGVINPYALAEVALGRSVAWNRVADKPGLLSQALGTSADLLFDGAHRTAPFALADLRTAGTPKVHAPLAGGDGQAAVKALGLKGLDVPAAALQRLADVLAPKAAAGNNVPYTGPGQAWRDVGDYFEEGAELLDPVQGAVGDCYLIAALASVAWSRPYVILHAVRQTGPGQQEFVDRIQYTFDGAVTTYEVTEKIPVRDTDSAFIYARSSEAGEVWPCIYEKAYAKHRSGNTTDAPPYDPMTGGDMVLASSEVLGGGSAPTYKSTASSSADDLWQFVRQNSLSYRTVSPMTAWTYAKGEDSPDKIKYDNASGIVGWHAYSVFGWAYDQGTKYIVLRNPWGQHEGKIDVKTGNWSARDVSFWRNVPLNTGGVFAMKAETFKKYYAGIGVAK